MNTSRPNRRRRAPVAAISACATLLLTAGTAHADLNQEQLRALTDRYLFRISLERFVEIRAERPHPDQLDWSSDSCSLAPNEPLGYDFTSSCDRHDFGYRNYRKQTRFTEDNRRRIDDNFRSDMYHTCARDLPCQGVAEVYYWAVREFGGVASSTADAIERAHIAPTTTATGKVTELRATNREGEPVRFHIG